MTTASPSTNSVRAAAPLEKRYRLTEALLLLLTILVLATGAFLAILAKIPAVMARSQAININTVTPQKLATDLSISQTIADKVVVERKRRGGFPDVDSLGETTSPLPQETYSAVKSRLIVRTWPEAQGLFLGTCVALAVALLVGHFVLRRFAPRADPFLLPLTGLLASLGVVLLFAIKDPLTDRTSFLAQATGTLTGIVLAMLLPASGIWGRLPLHRYGYLYALLACVLTALLAVAGRGPGGVRLSVLGFQPVEVVKALLVLFLAAYIAERGGLLRDPVSGKNRFRLPRREDVLPLLTLYTMPLVIFGIVRDLGPALILYGILLTMVYLATGRAGYIALGLVLLILGGCVGYWLKFGVFQTRVDMWLAPWKNGHPNGDHLALGWWGLASGGIFGAGLGLGGSEFIPRAGSDLAFASFAEESGVIGALTLLVCLVALITRGIDVARRAATDFDRYVAAGFSGLLGLQTLILVCGTLGILPLAGITLPLISYGKSSLLTSFLMIGALLAISARSGTPTTGELPPRLRGLQGFFVLTLGLLCGGWLVVLQVFLGPANAARPVITPDADGVRRPHINPRLLSLANQIPRGRILDRASRELAVNRGKGRYYPYGEAFTHIVGFVDPRVGGPTGLEAEYAMQLRGFGSWADLVNAWQRKDLPGFVLPKSQDIVLTLDAELQKAALAALRQQGARVRGRKTVRGAVVVLDVETGGILAAVTLPTFSPNGLTPEKIQTLNVDPNGDYPRINRALAGYYPPGSTFKIVTAASLLANGRDAMTINCGHIATGIRWTVGKTPYSRRRVVDDEGERAHGHIGLTEAVSESCNVYFARAGLDLGPETLRATAERFGFSKLPGTTAFGAELPDIAYGQGPMLATPLEMASVASTVARGGERLRPHFRKEEATEALATPLDAGDAGRLAGMMHQVTINGTAAGRFNDLGVDVAGKTGTAQNGQDDKKSHSWFIGFAPTNQPKIAFAVIVENGGYGATVAVPIAHAVLSQAFMGN